MSTQTLRSILGASSPASLIAHRTALLAIDFQNEYFTGSLPIPNGNAALQHARALVECADRHGWRVVHVQHVAPAGSPLFAADSQDVDILERVDAAAQAMAGEHQQAAGMLRVSAPLAIGTLELADWLPAFQKRYPDIQLELSCSDQFVDLIAGGLRRCFAHQRPIGRHHTGCKDVGRIGRRPGRFARLSGSPRTPRLSRATRPARVADFYRCSRSGGMGATPEQGASTHVVPRSRLRTDAITALYAAVMAGAGIAAFTRQTVHTALQSSHLVQILPGYTLGNRHYYALYPQTRYVAPKVRAFVDHMAEHYRAR